MNTNSRHETPVRSSDGYISTKVPEEEETLLLIEKNGELETSVVKSEGLDGGKEDLSKNLPYRRVSEIAAEMFEGGEHVCGFGVVKGRFLQRFANKNCYVVLYGILGCLMGAPVPYLTGIITTLEKRFKVSSTYLGIIAVASDISPLALCLVMTYFGDRGHRPRWIALGVYAMVLSCLLSALPQFLYGPGDDALALTLEYGQSQGPTHNTTGQLTDTESRQALCLGEGEGSHLCKSDSGELAPLVVLFVAQLLAGVATSVFYTLGVAYMDDNIKRAKAPLLISLSLFLRMLGPATGYGLAAASLSFYTTPFLTPVIDNSDPRWQGAWWLGWLALAAALAVFALPMLCFPRVLPRAAARSVQAAERRALGLSPELAVSSHPEMPASLTGSVGITFSAIGILSSGVIISKYKPRARPLGVWNIFVTSLSVLGIASFAFLGCPVARNELTPLTSVQSQTSTECSADCHCDFVKYAPVCSYGGQTFISACHAGCKNFTVLPSGNKVFSGCACVPSPDSDIYHSTSPQDNSRVVTPGKCPVDCTINFYIFLTIVCVNKFFGATARTSNFLVSVRCVEEKDKTMALALNFVLTCTFAFIPSPIFFGYLMDRTCLVWGKTCTGTGNCWIYDADTLRYIMSFTSAGFLFIAMLFELGVWFTVKNLNIFDNEVDMEMLSPAEVKNPRNDDTQNT